MRLYLLLACAGAAVVGYGLNHPGHFWPGIAGLFVAILCNRLDARENS